MNPFEQIDTHSRIQNEFVQDWLEKYFTEYPPSSIEREAYEIVLEAVQETYMPPKS